MSILDTSNGSINGSQTSQFNSPAEEIAYLRHKLADSQTEFLEFQESSRELEIEYETQVKQLEKKNNDFMNQLNKLENENHQLKSKHSLYTHDTQHKLTEFQEQLTELQALNARLTSYIRELEQNNDDLERARRTLAASLEDFELQLNQQIERNVLLENEVSEKEELECIVQRLKEETRDLKHELTIHSKQSDSAKRKQLNLDNKLATSQPESSLNCISPYPLGFTTQAQSSQNYINPYAPNFISDQVNDKFSSQSSGSQNAMVNGAVQVKPSMVDSTTSPPQTPSHFAFPSIASDGESSGPPSAKNTESKSQQTSASPSPTKSSLVMPLSSRISALNIVSDLLKKVGSLESKLATAKKVTNQPS